MRTFNNLSELLLININYLKKLIYFIKNYILLLCNISMVRLGYIYIL
jgi:hypothetical protein